jgi:serine protease Do
MGKFITLIIAFALLSGCANNYEKFYVENTSPIDQRLIIPTVGEPEIFSGSNNKDHDYIRMAEDGYFLKGHSGFHATGGATRANLIAQAKKVGASKVIYYSKYMSTESGTTSLTLPNTQTTYHSGGVSTYGAGGSGYGSYSGTSTTYGTQTTQIPYTRHRYEYLATYWVKIKMPVLGVQARNPNPDERADAGTNKGATLRRTR